MALNIHHLATFFCWGVEIGPESHTLQQADAIFSLSTHSERQQNEFFRQKSNKIFSVSVKLGHRGFIVWFTR